MAVTPIARWFVALRILCVLLPYLLGVRPRRPRGRRRMLMAIALLMWLLLGSGYPYSTWASAIVVAPPHAPAELGIPAFKGWREDPVHDKQ